MATARAQGGLKGERMLAALRKVKKVTFLPTCVMAHTNTTPYQGWQGRQLVRSSKKVKIWSLGIVSHTVWTMAHAG